MQTAYDNTVFVRCVRMLFLYFRVPSQSQSCITQSIYDYKVLAFEFRGLNDLIMEILFLTLKHIQRISRFHDAQ